MQEDTITASTTFSAIPISTTSIATLNIPANADLNSETNPISLKLDFNNDGINDVEMTSKPNKEAIYDQTAPDVKISFNKETKNLNIEATDNISDNIKIDKTKNKITATDEVGNNRNLPEESQNKKIQKLLLKS